MKALLHLVKNIMIKKIVCPTDFSEEAANATHYAAHLAHDLGAELMLIHVQTVPITSGVMLSGGLIEDTFESSHEASDLLENKSTELSNRYNISVSYEVDVTTASLTKILSTIAKQDSMIVMGAKSSSTLKDFLFGTGTYTIIRKTNSPILFVPAECTYLPYKKVVYAMAYEEKSRNALDSFYEFIKPFSTNVTILHISDHPSELGRDIFKAECSEIKEHFEGKLQFDFAQLYYKEVPEALTSYIAKNPTNLVVMAVRHRSILEVLFGKKSVLADLTDFPSFPVLVLHS